MFEESNYDRYYHSKKFNPASQEPPGPVDTINAKVRKAIENSFIKQMEENAVLENQTRKSPSNSKPHSIQTLENLEKENSHSFPNGSAEKANEKKENPSNSPVIPSARKSPSNESTKKSRKSRAPSVPSKELPDMLNQLPAAKIPAKRIMDAVIKEMVVVKALEHHSRIATDYEVDSLERTNRRIRKTISPKVNQNPSSNLSLVKGKVEETKPTNEILKLEFREGGKLEAQVKLNEEVLRRNYFNNLPELLSQRPEGYSLVSEVYVNDGYASPAGSDDSGPEISYEPENPGHLTIKVQDSPENYVKQDESEYEPDTLDRKPMRLKINGDVIYDRDITSESFVDSLERPAQILLRSKGSFRDEVSGKMGNGSLQRGYGSLREIYEARLRSNLKDSNIMGSTKSLNGEQDNTMSWKKNK